MKPARIAIIAIVLTVVATLYSLSELRALTAATNLGGDQRSLFEAPGQHGFKEVASEVAHKAIQHIEHLPQLHPGHHPRPEPTAGGATGADQPDEAELVAAEEAAAAAVLAKLPKACHAMAATELWGDVVVWGNNFKTDTPGECCKACQDFKPKGEEVACNVWVWCGVKEECKEQYHECWLKHLAHPMATKPARQGVGVPWTSGLVGEYAEPTLTQDASSGDRRYHVVTSAQGSAVHWQMRVHYYHYKKQREACIKDLGEKCAMGGFTRLLHSGKPDDLMNEIPTMVVDPLPQDTVDHSWYVVLNRPYAFVQWVKKAKITERFVLMSEPDHIFLRPMPNFMKGDVPASFPFFYIEPSKKENIPITQKFTGPLKQSELEMIAPIGNSPTFLTMDQMKVVMPVWMNMSIDIFKDKDASAKWGWVQEMYAFTIACFKVGIKHIDLYLYLMAQPPWDSKMSMGNNQPYQLLHYTYGNDFKLDGTFTPGKYGEWRFDKRSYSNRPPPRHLGAPPAGMKNDMVRRLIDSINEASDAIPCWDEYAKTGHVAPCSQGRPKAET